MEQTAAKVIVNNKNDWLMIVGIGAILLLLLSIPAVLSIGWTIAALLLAIIVFVLIRSRLVETWTWSNPEAHFYSWPLTLGSQTRVDYVRKRRRGTASGGSIKGWAAVTCTEVVTYSVGTDTRTEKATAFVDRFDVAGQSANGVARVPFMVSIPIHAGAPSMSVRCNEIKWDLAARLCGMTSRGSDAAFQLTVAPVLTDQVDWSEDGWT